MGEADGRRLVASCLARWAFTSSRGLGRAGQSAVTAVGGGAPPVCRSSRHRAVTGGCSTQRRLACPDRDVTESRSMRGSCFPGGGQKEPRPRGSHAHRLIDPWAGRCCIHGMPREARAAPCSVLSRAGTASQVSSLSVTPRRSRRTSAPANCPLCLARLSGPPGDLCMTNSCPAAAS